MPELGDTHGALTMDKRGTAVCDTPRIGLENARGDSTIRFV